MGFLGTWQVLRLHRGSCKSRVHSGPLGERRTAHNVPLMTGTCGAAGQLNLKFANTSATSVPVGVQIANPYKPGQCRRDTTRLCISRACFCQLFTQNTQVCSGCRPEIEIDMRSQNRTAVLIGSTNSLQRKETMGISTDTCEVWNRYGLGIQHF